MTFVLGLTGSIGMGKSATAAMFRALGVPVHDADAVVHALYRGAAAPLIAKAFPGTVADGVVDRSALGQEVLGQPERLKELEAIVHPLVRAERDAFLTAAVAARAPVAVIDIPLLFETGGERDCDAVLVVTASRGGAARARPRPRRDDGGEVRSDCGEADAGRGKTAKGAFPCGHRPRLCCRRAPSRRYPACPCRAAGRRAAPGRPRT